MKIYDVRRFNKYIFGVFCLLISTVAVFPQNAVKSKPVVAVLEFETRPKVYREAGRELSEMLINALLETQRFTVVDRAKTKMIQDEQVSVLLGSVDPATGATIGKLTGAQYLVLGSVTEFKNNKSKAGFFGKKLNIPGMDNIAAYQAVVKFNLRVVNSTTGEIVFGKAVEKDVRGPALSGDSNVFGVAMGKDFESKAMHDAVSQAIGEVVMMMGENISASSVPPSVQSVAANTASLANCSAVTGGKAPRVMVVIPEIHIAQKIPDPAGETEIIKKLVERGFNVVDQKQIAAIRDREKVLFAVKNPAAAANLGAEFGADIIIIGEAFSEFAARQGNLFSTRARVEARAIRTDSARILAADGKFGSGLDVAEFVSAKTALRNAGSQWADYFITQICQNLLKNELSFSSPTSLLSQSLPTNASSDVEIMISNINFNELKQFTDRLAKIPGVRGVQKTLTENIARIRVAYEGSGEKLADAVSTTKFGLMKVNIIGLSGNKIEIGIGK